MKDYKSFNFDENQLLRDYNKVNFKYSYTSSSNTPIDKCNYLPAELLMSRKSKDLNFVCNEKLKPFVVDYRTYNKNLYKTQEEEKVHFLKYNNNFTNKILHWARCVDDIFCICSATERQITS